MCFTACCELGTNFDEHLGSTRCASKYNKKNTFFSQGFSSFQLACAKNLNFRRARLKKAKDSQDSSKRVIWKFPGWKTSRTTRLGMMYSLNCKNQRHTKLGVAAFQLLFGPQYTPPPIYLATGKSHTQRNSALGCGFTGHGLVGEDVCVCAVPCCEELLVARCFSMRSK